MSHYLTRHLDKVGESYLEHLRFAFTFGGRMVAGGVGCILHGLMPWTFETTGSRTIKRLNTILTTGARGNSRTAEHGMLAADYQI